jgi:hypothetical protein
MTSPLVGEWPGAVPLCPGLVALVLAVWPGAAPECPGLVAVVFAAWPGAAPECPGLVALVLAVWPETAPDYPGLLETEFEDPVGYPAVRTGAGTAVEVALRAPAGVRMMVCAGADDRVRTGAETPR